jgi:hypothetical protein
MEKSLSTPDFRRKIAQNEVIPTQKKEVNCEEDDPSSTFHCHVHTQRKQHRITQQL